MWLSVHQGLWLCQVHPNFALVVTKLLHSIKVVLSGLGQLCSVPLQAVMIQFQSLTPQYKSLNWLLFFQSLVAEGQACSSKSVRDPTLCCTGFTVYNMNREVAGHVCKFLERFVNGLVGGLSWFGRREMKRCLPIAKNFLGTEASTDYAATCYVISFHYEKVF